MCESKYERVVARKIDRGEKAFNRKNLDNIYLVTNEVCWIALHRFPVYIAVICKAETILHVGTVTFSTTADFRANKTKWYVDLCDVFVVTRRVDVWMCGKQEKL